MLLQIQALAAVAVQVETLTAKMAVLADLALHT